MKAIVKEYIPIKGTCRAYEVREEYNITSYTQIGGLLYLYQGRYILTAVDPAHTTIKE